MAVTSKSNSVLHYIKKLIPMPLYMDLHKGLKGVKKEVVENAHLLDVQVQDKHG